MVDLARWLGEQFDADEQEARRGYLKAEPIPDYDGWNDSTTAGLPPAVAARVLREIDAKRRILDECAYWHDKLAKEAAEPPPIPYPGLGQILDAVTPILRALALPYSDRPGYREEWRP